MVKNMILEDISKYFISFGMMMTFTIFNINKHFLYNHIEKSRVLLFNEILSKKHAAPPIFNFLKQSVRCGIISKEYLFGQFKKREQNQDVIHLSLLPFLMRPTLENFSFIIALHFRIFKDHANFIRLLLLWKREVINLCKLASGKPHNSGKILCE